MPRMLDLSYDAGERDVLKHGVFLIIIVVCHFTSIRIRDDSSTQILLAFGNILPLLIQLPSLLVVLTGMEELAVVAKSAEACCCKVSMGVL
ncbi:hypothetical protein HYQ46_009342 [Verticillium longisporum]|nr:hypothetical protein HYQ46_009342 [Verticillium longisporum]